MMMDIAKFEDEYISYIKSFANDGDCYPQPCMYETGGEMTMAALALPGLDCLAHGARVAREGASVIGVGMDMSARGGQGTKLSDVFVYVVVERGGFPVFGMVEYDGSGETIATRLSPGDFWHKTLAPHFSRVMSEMGSTLKGGA